MMSRIAEGNFPFLEIRTTAIDRLQMSTLPHKHDQLSVSRRQSGIVGDSRIFMSHRCDTSGNKSFDLLAAVRTDVHRVQGRENASPFNSFGKS